METEAFTDTLNLEQRQKKIYRSKICQNSLQKREVWRIPLRMVEFHLPLAQKTAGFNVTVTAISKKCRTLDENRIGNVQKTRKSWSNH